MIVVDCHLVRMVLEGKKELEVAVRMDSLDEGRPLRYEHSVYVYERCVLGSGFTLHYIT